MGILSIMLNVVFVSLLFIYYRHEYIVLYAHKKFKLCWMCVCKAKTIRQLKESQEALREKKEKLPTLYLAD